MSGDVQGRITAALQGTSSVPELIEQHSQDYDSMSGGAVREADHPIFSINDKQIRHVNTLKGPTIMHTGTASDAKLEKN